MKRPYHAGIRHLCLGVAALLVCGLFSSSAYAWYNPSWAYRQEITILPALADSNLSGFPYLVKITDAANAVFANALPNFQLQYQLQIRARVSHGNSTR